MTRLSVAEQQELLRINERAVDELAKLRARCERLERALDEIRLLVMNQVEDVHNSIGGTVGYTLTLYEEQTRLLWGLCDRAALSAPEPKVRGGGL